MITGWIMNIEKDILEDMMSIGWERSFETKDDGRRDRMMEKRQKATLWLVLKMHANAISNVRL